MHVSFVIELADKETGQVGTGEKDVFYFSIAGVTNICQYVYNKNSSVSALLCDYLLNQATIK